MLSLASVVGSRSFNIGPLCNAHERWGEERVCVTFLLEECNWMQGSLPFPSNWSKTSQLAEDEGYYLDIRQGGIYKSPILVVDLGIVKLALQAFGGGGFMDMDW